jgi:hypothetical protein
MGRAYLDQEGFPSVHRGNAVGMTPPRQTDDRLADPEIEDLLDEKERGSQVPDDERVVPEDFDELVIDDDEQRQVG